MKPPATVFRELARSLPNAEELDHMGSPSFRVAGKIFAQLVEEETTGLVKLSLAEQDACVRADPHRFWVPQHWSKFGWTYVRLAGSDAAELRGFIERSWSLVAPRKLVTAFRAAPAER